MNEISNISTGKLFKEDISSIIEAFHKVGWLKSSALLEEYLEEQKLGERLVWVACQDNQIAGYVTLKWQSSYPPFQGQHIPEIMDLNVLPAFRNRGIGSFLLDCAEKEAATKGNWVGLGVGLYGGPDGGYGAAQRLYVKRGYIPDGKGVTYDYQYVIPGDNYPLDDDLILWLTKKIK
jgi:GNAT superfamily N-acetyltransferase